MAINDISLTTGMRQNLVSLQQSADLLNRTQNRLGTGLKVSSPTDDPAVYFKALGHTNAASDLAALKDNMSESVQTIKAAQVGIKSITGILDQMKATINSAKNATTSADKASYATQYDALRTQLDNIAEDSTYGGVNLIKGSTPDNLTTNLNADATNTVVTTGVTSNSAGLAISAAASAWDSSVTISVQNTAITQAESNLTSAYAELRVTSQSFSASLGIISTRLDFTTNMINNFSEGASKLTTADTNEEGANMLALQTRQQLGTISLSLASQANQSVLRLF